MTAVNKKNVVQIVRNFTPYGGMESYVWNLSHELLSLGYKVSVICEKSAAGYSPLIEVLEIGQSIKKPRWLVYYLFRIKVSKIQAEKFSSNSIIHSHERSLNHDITTIHSDLFKVKFLLEKFISIKVFIYTFLERKEIFGDKITRPYVVPVSNNLKRDLILRYPSAKKYILNPIVPGVNEPKIKRNINTKKKVFTIGFIGKEWKRKGLLFFSKIVIELSGKIPNLKIIILGPEKKDIDWIFKESNLDIFYGGWQRSEDFYSKMDLLIHPANSEAYGMVVAESMANGIPVVTSNKCGASMSVSRNNGTVLSLKDPLALWISSCIFWLTSNKRINYNFPWSRVAIEYSKIYERISLEGKFN